MSTPVWVTDAAARDVDEVVAAAVEQAGVEEADRILTRIQSIFERLGEGGSATAGIHPVPGHPRARVLYAVGLRVVVTLRGGEMAVVAVAPIGRSTTTLLLRRLLDT
jgi:plasmid stabilization system protein ParE